ncbi:hypothetical protein IC575_027691 [Cucumis melo]
MPSSSIVFRWLSLIGIIWLQSINGTNFNFPSYSSQLKQQLSMSQLQLNNLAFASDAGKLFACFSGLAANYLPLWLVLFIGSSLGLIGYGVQYLFITNHFHSPSYWLIFFLTVLAGNSICWINTVCYMVAITNFASSNRQVAVGISTSYQGLSAKVYTDIVGSIFSNKDSSKTAETFLLLNSVLPLGVCVLVSPLARFVKIVEEQGKLEVGFFVIFVITIATGTFATITSVGSVSRMLSALSGLVGIMVFLVLPLVVVVEEKVKERVEKGKEGRVYHFTVEENNDVERIMRGENERKVERTDDGEAMEEIGAKEMVKRINFWLYFGVYLFGATLGLAFLNNLGQIAESRGSSSVSSLVSLSSSFGFFGRLLPSILDYFLSRRNKFMKSKPGWMVGLMGALCGGFFLLLSPSDTSLCMSTAIIAICTGAITSISVSTTTDLFGATNFSINHNVVVANIPFGSFIFGYMAAFLYHKQAGHGVTAGKCIGVECYRTTFLIWGCFSSFGTFLALLLFARTRSFYSTTDLSSHISPN